MNGNEKEYDWGSSVEETYELNDIARELLIVNQTTMERLFAEKNQNALVLYLFYYKTAKWQNTTVIRASDKYCKECLHWGIDKLQLAKKTLINMKLIEIIKKKDEQNRISGWFVKINYLEKATIPISTIPIFPDVVKQDTNAIYNNSCEKILYNNKKKGKEKNEVFSNEFINANEDLKTKTEEWLKYKKERKEGYKEQGLKSLLTQIEKKCKQYGKAKVIDLMDECMANNWQGIIWNRLEQVKKVNNDIEYTIY